MTVLEAAAFMGLGRYALHHRKLTDTHIQVWWLVGRADARCHSEHLEWVRRRCGADHSQGLCPDSGSTRRSVLDQHRGATCPFACLPRAVPCLWKGPKWWLSRAGGSEEAEPVKEDVDGGTAGHDGRRDRDAGCQQVCRVRRWALVSGIGPGGIADTRARSAGIEPLLRPSFGNRTT